MTHYRMDDQANPPPRDGTPIDLWTGNDRVVNASWNGRFSRWQYFNEHGFVEANSDAAFTHWSPIVPPGNEPQEPLPALHNIVVLPKNARRCTRTGIPPADYDGSNGSVEAIDAEPGNLAINR